MWWPAAGFALAWGAVVLTHADLRLAGLFYDARSGAWLGASTGSWWAHRLLHDQGRWLVRGIAAAAILVWTSSFRVPGLRAWRVDAGFVALAMLLAVGIVGSLKAVTNVDCPWDLAGFGGSRPAVALLAHRPDYLPRARCFPGAHSSSGFALLCFYFVCRDRAPRYAGWALGLASLVGCAFAIGQEARGAHFLSHDLASAAIVWLVLLGLYAAKARVPRAPAPAHR